MLKPITRNRVLPSKRLKSRGQKFVRRRAGPFPSQEKGQEKQESLQKHRSAKKPHPELQNQEPEKLQAGFRKER